MFCTSGISPIYSVINSDKPKAGEGKGKDKDQLGPLSDKSLRPLLASSLSGRGSRGEGAEPDGAS